MKIKTVVVAVAILTIIALPVTYGEPVFVASSADAVSPVTFSYAPRTTSLPVRQASYAQPTLRMAASVVPQKIVAANGFLQ